MKIKPSFLDIIVALLISLVIAAIVGNTVFFILARILQS